MPSSKTNRRNKTKRRQKKTKRNNRVRGGGACSDFSQLPIRHYYPMNNYANDVQGAQLASRLQPGPVYGGKKTRHHISKKRSNKKIKGGSLVSTLHTISNVTSSPFNMSPSLITNSGNISSAINGANIIYGYPNTSSNLVDPPNPNYLV